MRRRTPGPATGGAATATARSLRPLVEVLDADDGSLYLLRGPAHGDLVVREASAATRAVVHALRTPGSVAEVVERCRATGAQVDGAAVGEVLAALEAADLVEAAPPAAPPLAPEDRQRLDRQLLYLRQVAPEGVHGEVVQARLRRSRVVVLGCGGLGSWAAWAIASLGVGTLVLVDFDVVETTNLNRQLLFAAADVGRLKCEVAAERLRAFDPALDVVPVSCRLGGVDDVVAQVEGADLVIACADAPPYDIARWIDAGCRAAGVPHISAGQLPPLARVGPFVVPGEAPCVGCLERALRATTPLYGELEKMRKADPRPAATLGPACGLIGSMLALDALGWLSGLHRPSTLARVLTVDIRTMEVSATPVAADPACPCAAA
jgi:molybdopterin/thiamine biosynthesis adenylyltransferase